jgi:hypothetical protein
MTEAGDDQGYVTALTMHWSIPHIFSILVRLRYPLDSRGTLASNSPSSQSNRSNREYHLTRTNLQTQTRETRSCKSDLNLNLGRNWASPGRRVGQNPLRQLLSISPPPRSPSPILQTELPWPVNRGPPFLLQVLSRRLSERSDGHLRHTTRTTRTWEGLSCHLARHDHMT